MAVAQASYSERMRVALPGMIADMTSYDADSRFVETAGGIPPGVAVSQGTAANQVKLGSTSVDLFAGISVRDITLPPDHVTALLRDGLSVMFRGDIWIAVGGVVLSSEPVTFNSTTGVLSAIAASGTQFTIAGARWMTSQSTVGGLAICRLSGSLPSANLAS